MKKNKDHNYGDLRAELSALMTTCGVSARVLAEATQYSVSQQAISAFLSGKVGRLHACTYPVYGDMLAALRYAAVMKVLPEPYITAKRKVDIIRAALSATKE